MDKSVIELINDCVIIVDSSLRVVSVNCAAEIFFRFHESVAGKKIAGVLGGFIADKNVALHKPKTYLGKSVQRTGSTKLNICGEERFVYYKLALLNDGKSLQYAIVITDMTMVHTLYNDHYHLLTAFENVNEVILITDPEANIMYVNPAFERTTGYRANEVIGKNPRILKSGEHDALFYKNMWKTICSGQVWEGVFLNQRKNGTLYYDRASISPVFNEAGEIINFVSIKHDITESRLAEERIKISEQKNRAILATVGEGVVVIGEKSNIRFVNQELLNIFGHEKKDIIGKNIKKLMPEQYRQAHDEGMKKFLTTGKAAILGKRMEIEGLRKNGDIFPIELRVDETWIAETGDRFFSGAIRDITSRKNAEKAIREGAKNLEQLAQFKDKMISVISHDLRSPLTSNIGLIELSLNSKTHPLSDWQHKIISTLGRSANHQLNLVENLVELSRLHRGAMEIKPEPVVAYKIIKESALILNQMAVEKDIELLVGEPSDCVINVDKEKMVQVLNNLITNSIKFTNRGGRIAVAVFDGGDKVELNIEDDGIGISEERINILFDLTKKTTTFGTEGETGTGLGLPICKEITELNDGVLTLESELGKGCKARVKFKKC